jgi:hypothetical protein
MVYPIDSSTSGIETLFHQFGSWGITKFVEVVSRFSESSGSISSGAGQDDSKAKKYFEVLQLKRARLRRGHRHRRWVVIGGLRCLQSRVEGRRGLD